MDEADYLCNRVGIIDEGEIVALGDPDELKNELEGDVVVLDISGSEDISDVFDEVDYVSNVKIMDGSLQLTVKDGEKVIPDLLEVAQKNGGRVDSVSLRKPTLEDVFIHHTGRSLREEKAGAKDRTRMRKKAGGR